MTRGPGAANLTRPQPLLFIPTYNERESVETIYRQIKALGLDIDLLFLDDNSPDGTGELLEQLKRRDDRLSVLHRPAKLGIGSAHRAGIKHAYAQGYQILVTMDCDLTHSVSDIPRLLTSGSEADVVLTSRFLNAESLSDWNPVRKLLTHLGHTLTKLVLRVPYDATGGFRLYRLDQIAPGIFDLATSDSYSFLFESLYFLWHCGVRVNEIPIVLTKRAYGHSKMTAADIFKSVSKLVGLYVRSLRSSSTRRELRAAQKARTAARSAATREF